MYDAVALCICVLTSPFDAYFHILKAYTVPQACTSKHNPIRKTILTFTKSFEEAVERLPLWLRLLGTNNQLSLAVHSSASCLT